MKTLSVRLLLLRLFLLTAVPFGITSSVFIAVIALIFRPEMLRQGVLLGLAAGFCFGAAMTAVPGTLHLTAVRRRAGKDWRVALPPRQMREVYLPLEPEQAMAAAEAALRDLTGKAAPSASPASAGFLQATTSTGWESFGEEITVRFVPVEMGGTAVTITSAPVVPTTLVDTGKNFQNVERLADRMQQLCRVRA